MRRGLILAVVCLGSVLLLTDCHIGGRQVEPLDAGSDVDGAQAPGLDAQLQGELDAALAGEDAALWPDTDARAELPGQDAATGPSGPDAATPPAPTPERASLTPAEAAACPPPPESSICTTAPAA